MKMCRRKPPSLSFGGCHSIHLRYGRDAVILQEIPKCGDGRDCFGGTRTGRRHLPFGRRARARSCEYFG